MRKIIKQLLKTIVDGGQRTIKSLKLALRPVIAMEPQEQGETKGKGYMSGRHEPYEKPKEKSGEQTATFMKRVRKPQKNGKQRLRFDGSPL